MRTWNVICNADPWICCSNSIETIRTVLKPSGQYRNRPDSIETVRTVLKPSGQYWNRPDSIQTVLTVFKLSKQYSNCSEANSLKPFILSGHGLHCEDKCGPFRLPLHVNRAKTFRTRKNFPVSNADALRGFLALWRFGSKGSSLSLRALWFAGPSVCCFYYSTLVSWSSHWGPLSLQSKLNALLPCITLTNHVR